jgi:hypothetical protein
LQYKEGDKTSLDMKVITGRPLRRTPVLIRTISTVVLAPAWSVPRRSGESTLINRTLLDDIHTLQQLFKPNQAIEIISGYRSPKTNEKLRAMASLTAVCIGKGRRLIFVFQVSI